MSPKEEKKKLLATCGPNDRVYSARLQMTFAVRDGGEDFDSICRRLFAMAESVAKREDQTRAYLDLSVTWPKVKP